jgi:hypothetical protein
MCIKHGVRKRASTRTPSSDKKQIATSTPNRGVGREDGNCGGGTCMVDVMSLVRERPINIEFMNE